MTEHDIAIETARWETAVMLRALDVYGAGNQLWQTLEELFELGLAICKLRREKTAERWDNVVEERADVGIMLDQLDLMLDCLGCAKGKRAEKLARLDRRLEDKAHHEQE